MIERALGQGPEINIVPGRRQHPGIFELLGSPDLGETVPLGSRRTAMACDRGVHIKERAIGVEHESAYGHHILPTSSRKPRSGYPGPSKHRRSLCSTTCVYWIPALAWLGRDG